MNTQTAKELIVLRQRITDLENKFQSQQEILKILIKNDENSIAMFKTALLETQENIANLLEQQNYRQIEQKFTPNSDAKSKPN